MALSTDPFSFDVPNEDVTVTTTSAPATTVTPRWFPRCLCRFDDGAVFAYGERGHEFVRASDRELWAVERDGVLVSARSGHVLAIHRGRVYFAADTAEPLYYERAV